jgi:oligopeptidase B
VAHLRRTATSATDPARPVVLRTELGAGHGGPSGRYEAWRDQARVMAFLLWYLTPRT